MMRVAKAGVIATSPDSRLGNSAQGHVVRMEDARVVSVTSAGSIVQSDERPAVLSADPTIRHLVDDTTAPIPNDRGEPPQRTETMNDKITRWSVGLFGNSSQTGQWQAGQPVRAVAVFGDSTLDLRDAVTDGDEIDIDDVAMFGDVHIIVAPGSRVELSGVALLDDKRTQLSAAESTTGPQVRINALAMLGDVTVQ